MTAVHNELGRPVFIAEFGYPAEILKVGPFLTWNHALEQYPLTPQGQANLMRDLVVWGSRAGVSGIRPWAPEVTAPHWLPFALFGVKNETAVARPSLDAIAEGLRSRKP